jgi:hypothetical protein
MQAILTKKGTWKNNGPAAVKVSITQSVRKLVEIMYGIGSLGDVTVYRTVLYYR